MSKDHAGAKRTLLDEYEKKDRHFQRLIASTEGDDRRSTRNAIIADNETTFETGHFAIDRGANEYDQYGFIVRGRRDAMVARLNSADALDTIDKIERMLRDRTLLLRPRRGRYRLFLDFSNAVVLALGAYWIANMFGTAAAIGFSTLCIILRIEASGRDER